MEEDAVCISVRQLDPDLETQTHDLEPTRPIAPNLYAEIEAAFTLSQQSRRT
jgi:hypothetical protein